VTGAVSAALGMLGYLLDALTGIIGGRARSRTRR
jgi:hypothetical protein